MLQHSRAVYWKKSDPKQILVRWTKSDYRCVANDRITGYKYLFADFVA